MARIAKAESREVRAHCPPSARDGAIACLPALRPSAAHHQAHLHTLNSLPQLPQKAIAVSPATDAQAHLNHVEPDEAEPEREITDEERMKRTSQAERVAAREEIRLKKQETKEAEEQAARIAAAAAQADDDDDDWDTEADFVNEVTDDSRLQQQKSAAAILNKNNSEILSGSPHAREEDGDVAAGVGGLAIGSRPAAPSGDGPSTLGDFKPAAAIQTPPPPPPEVAAAMAAKAAVSKQPSRETATRGNVANRYLVPVNAVPAPKVEEEAAEGGWKPPPPPG